MSLRQACLVAGSSLLLITLLAIFAEGYVRSGLVVAGDANATINNLSNHLTLFRWSIAAFVGIVILDVVVALALYDCFKLVSQVLSLWMTIFRLVYAAVFCVSVFELSALATYLQIPTAMGVTLTAHEAQTQALFAMASFSNGWSMALMIFSVHLLLLSYLCLKARWVPTWLAVLVAVAGLGYLVDGIGKLVVANYSLEVSMFTFVGELLLMLWLLYKGVRTPASA